MFGLVVGDVGCAVEYGENVGGVLGLGGGCEENRCQERAEKMRGCDLGEMVAERHGLILVYAQV